MPGVIVMMDGKTYTLLGPGDLIYLARKYAGDEFAGILEEYLDGLDEACAEAEGEVNELREDLEGAQEHFHETLCSIREEAESISDLLDKTRLDRKKIREGVNNIWKIANDEL